MNRTHNETIEDVNAFLLQFNIPVIVFMLFFMLLGIVGNSLTLYIYLFRMKSSTLKIFIIYLGFVDMIGCCLCVPLEIVYLIRLVMYPSKFLCKFYHLILYYSCICSICSLLMIAVERFNRVCRPLSLQMSPTHAKRIVAVLSLFSFLLALPVYMAFTREKILFQNDIVGHKCHLYNVKLGKGYFYFLIVLFCISLFIIIVLYLLIRRKARQHFRQLKARKQKLPKEESDHLTQSNNESNHNSSQINMTIFNITGLFFVSFSPNFIITLFEPEYTFNTYALLCIGQRLWVLNCSLNPVVYGICNGEFRQKLKRLFSKETSQKSSHIQTCELTARNPVRHPVRTEITKQ